MIYIITLLSYKEYIIYDICFVYLCAIFKEQFERFYDLSKLNREVPALWS